MVKLVRLKKGVYRPRYTIYSKWVYDDGGAEPGDEVIIQTYDRRDIGIGVYDGYGPISVRLLSTDKIASVKDILKENIGYAYQIRRRLNWRSYRLVNSEGDRIPGLIIDVYNDTAVIQSGSGGLDHYLEYIAEVLRKLGIADRVYVRNDQRSRREVGLEIWGGWILGYGDTRTVIEEGRTRYIVDFEKGRKTGFFLDQRINRLLSTNFSSNTEVLDLFSYTGAFGIQALLNGASKAVFIEKDRDAIETLYENLKINNISMDRAEVHEEDVFKYLGEDDRKYGLVIIDPNAMIQRREETQEGIERYRSLYIEAFRHLKHGGVAFLSSCSYFLTPSKFLNIVGGIKDSVLLTRVLGASPDHVYRWDTPELNYLKAIFIARH